MTTSYLRFDMKSIAGIRVKINKYNLIIPTNKHEYSRID